MDHRQREAQENAVADGRGERTAGAPGQRHAALKSATRAAHEATDAASLSAGYFEDRTRFADYLHRLQAFHAGYARAVSLHDSSGWRARWSIDQHGPWIAAELAVIAGPVENTTRPLSRIEALQIGGRAGLLGSLYVLAGSTLGAHVLNRLCASRDVPGPGGSTYFAALSRSLRWPAFLAFLETADIDSESAMIEGALATFESIGWHLSQPRTA